jgi:hypothetical protein
MSFLLKLKNNIWLGLGIGLLLPLIFCSIAWYLINHVIFLKKADLLYIAGIALNAYLLNYFLKFNRENIGRGLLAATFIWAMIFFFYKVS